MNLVFHSTFVALSNAHRYDNYDRQGPKVFMGEYAAQSDKVVSVFNRNNLECALAEAAYMTGLERNADIVRLAAYAPLFANAEAWQWTPDLIWVNNLGICVTPSYFVQQLFGRNRGDVVLPARIAPAEGAGPSTAPLCFVSAARDEAAGEVIVKFVNAGDAAASVRLQLVGAGSLGPEAHGEVLTSAAKTDCNSFEHAARVAPVAVQIPVPGAEFPYTFPANSFTVLRLKASPAK